MPYDLTYMFIKRERKRGRKRERFVCTLYGFSGDTKNLVFRERKRYIYRERKREREVCLYIIWNIMFRERERERLHH